MMRRSIHGVKLGVKKSLDTAAGTPAGSVSPARGRFRRPPKVDRLSH